MSEPDLERLPDWVSSLGLPTAVYQPRAGRVEYRWPGVV